MTGPRPAPAARLAAAALLAAVVVAALLPACGVKAPPRPPGAPEKAPPADVLQPGKGSSP